MKEITILGLAPFFLFKKFISEKAEIFVEIFATKSSFLEAPGKSLKHSLACALDNPYKDSDLGFSRVGCIVVN